MSIQILDCTLRDGGYINGWKFGSENIDYIISRLDDANIDIIEIGFYTDMKHENGDALYSDEQEIRRTCRNPQNSQYAAMIALGEKEISPEKLPDSSESLVDIIRVTFHKNNDEIDKAIRYANVLMSKNYKVCMQPVGLNDYDDVQLLELIKKVNELSPFAFYIVDTLGVMNKQDILKYLFLIDSNLNDDIKIGLHSHNNMQMSFSHAQEIINFDSKHDFIIDASLYGMGRGAGNLCTELLTQYINENVEARYNLIPVLEAIDEYILPLYSRMSWGYSVPYYLAAANKCHPNYATYLMDKQTLCIKDINSIIKQIPHESRNLYNSELIQDLYISYHRHIVDDSCVISEISNACSNRDVLVLAPGYTLISQKEKVHKYIDEYNPIVFAVNNIFEFYNCDYVFISNIKRMQGTEKEDYNKLICASNIDVDDVRKINYSSYLVDDDIIADNAGLMLINVLVKAGVKSIRLAGFDGFVAGQRNYSSDVSFFEVDIERLNNLNKAISKYFKRMSSQMDIEFITDSLYKN